MDKENGNRKKAQRGKSLPKGSKWEGQGAKREKKKGRPTSRNHLVVVRRSAQNTATPPIEASGSLTQSCIVFFLMSFQA
jgi:hypothetical protein